VEYHNMSDFLEAQLDDLESRVNDLEYNMNFEVIYDSTGIDIDLMGNNRSVVLASARINFSDLENAMNTWRAQEDKS